MLRRSWAALALIAAFGLSGCGSDDVVKPGTVSIPREGGGAPAADSKAAPEGGEVKAPTGRGFD